MTEFTNDDNILIDNCYTLAVKLMREAGEIVSEGYRKVKMKIEFKQPGNWDIVSEYDGIAEKLLIDEIRKIYPDHIFFAEETARYDDDQIILGDAPTWFIDPIDGTNSFVHGLPQFGMSIALSLKKELVLGVVYNPILNEMYRARLGNGSFLNDKPITCSKVENLNQCLYAHEISFVHVEKVREKNIKRIYKFASICAGSRSFGSVALTLAYVARGSVDCYIIDDLQAWDSAAGVLLVKEANGKVYNINGSKYNFMEPYLICGATEELCQQIIVGIKEADKFNLITE